MASRPTAEPKTRSGRTKADPGASLAQRFGALIRERRKELKLTQDDLALASGVSRRLVIDLEDGRAGIRLGRALLVAEALGLRLFDLMKTHAPVPGPMLPDLPDDADLPP